MPRCSRLVSARGARSTLALALGLAGFASSSAAVEHVTVRRAGAEVAVTGQVVVTTSDGGLLLRAGDGTLWNVLPDDVLDRRSDPQPFAPLDEGRLGRQLLVELPPGFSVYTTQHYLICYNTSRAYAEWCGGLFEQLYRVFTNYWTRRGFDLSPPRQPLIAVVFAERSAYVAHSQAELGDGSQSILGYYSLRSNRMTLCDLTGVEALRRPGDRRGSVAQIQQMLARPQAERSVATVIHEATHQIAFNCGLHQRYADIPLWVSEGLAVYFETPDLASQRGWRRVGTVNAARLASFRDYLRRRPAGSLESLLAADGRFRDSRAAQDAYAEAWALNYFLLRQRPEEYQAYLRTMAQKDPLVWDNPAVRLKEFKQAFGSDLSGLDEDFVKFLAKVKPGDR